LTENGSALMAVVAAMAMVAIISLAFALLEAEYLPSQLARDRARAPHHMQLRHAPRSARALARAEAREDSRGSAHASSQT
jgi:hypothetical protein